MNLNIFVDTNYRENLFKHGFKMTYNMKKKKENPNYAEKIVEEIKNE